MGWKGREGGQNGWMIEVKGGKLVHVSSLSLSSTCFTTCNLILAVRGGRLEGVSQSIGQRAASSIGLGWGGGGASK